MNVGSLSPNPCLWIYFKMLYHKLFSKSKDTATTYSFFIKASRLKVSNLTNLSLVLRSGLKPDWNRSIVLLDSKNQVSLLLIILCFT